MKATRREAKHNITGRNILPIKDFVFFYNPNRKSSKVVLAFRVHTRHFGSLSTDQCATRELTACRDSSYDTLGDINREAATRKVIKEEKWLRPLHAERGTPTRQPRRASGTIGGAR